VVTYSPKVFIPLTRLCRDRCHYCTFVTTPGHLEREAKNGQSAAFLSPDEVVDIARQGTALGCTEALFTLGDRPEERWPAAADWLDAHGYDSTLAYVRAMAIGCWKRPACCRISTPGVMSWEEMNRLKPVSPSMGMMLETSSRPAASRTKGRGPLRLAGQGPSGPGSRARGCRQTVGPVHDRAADR
jgi:FO synthase